MLRLNLASGTDLKSGDGWVNLDVVPRWPLATRGCDVIWDARKDRIPYPDASAAEVYAGYLFLHLAPHHHTRVLADIRRVLMPGGRLVVGEVEMDTVLARWILNPTDARLAELIWGEQGELPNANEEQRRLAEFDKHCHGYTEKTLREFLARGGFANARRIRVHSEAVWYELTLEAIK
jgi:ubiquinone/menaquinone biosynthesis C-methylase UbiE